MTDITNAASCNEQLTAQGLLGAEQGWIAQAHKALHGAESSFLSPKVLAALSQDNHRHRIGADSMQWSLIWSAISQPLDVALADLALGKDIVDSGGLRSLLEVFGTHGLRTVGGSSSQFDGRLLWIEHQTRIQAAAFSAVASDHPAGKFVALLLHVIATGTRAKSRGHSQVSIPVLLHNDANTYYDRPLGEVGTLTLTVWPQGPAGLHPDPRTMAFSTVDDQVISGLASVMSASPHVDAGSCVTWAVQDPHGAPVRQLEGDSLTAAVGLLLHELTTRQSRFGRLAWRVRPQRLGRTWTATAGVVNGRLTRVEHYASKFAAVAALPIPLRVIAASDEAIEIGRRYGVEVTLLETLDQAVATTRTLNRMFAAGLVTSLIFVLAFVGVITWAEHSVSAANLAAEKRSVATGLMQHARGYLKSDPRLAALSALAADDLDPSVRTQEVMMEVLRANPDNAGTAKVTSSYVKDVMVANRTLLVLDGRGQVTAWRLPELSPLGVLVNDGARALGPAGSTSAAVLVGSTLHLYVTADGYLPREVKAVETGLKNDAKVFGPYQTRLRDGFVLLDKDFRGVYFDLSMAQPVMFSAHDDPVLEKDSARRSLEVTAVAPQFSDSEQTPSGMSDLATVLVATTSRQIIRIDAHVGDAKLDRPDIAVTELMPSEQARAAIRTLSVGPGDTLLLGTDRGVQWFNTAEEKTTEFPYGGWSEQVNRILNNSYWHPVIVGKNRIEFFDEPQDDRPRATPHVVEFDGASITAITEDSLQARDTRQYVVGREDGTVTVLDPSDTRFGPGAVGGSNFLRFTTSGHLLQTSGDSPQRSDSINVVAIPSEESNVTGGLVGDVVDPHLKTYNLPAVNGWQPYVNDAASSDKWVVASGRQSSGYGRLWVWHLGGGDPATEISFGAGESGENSVPDIVQAVDFVAGGRELVALNSAKGELGFWSVGDWKQIGSIKVPKYNDFNSTGSVRIVVSQDGKTIALRESDTTIKIIDVVGHRVKHTLHLPEAELSDLSISPDGKEVVVVDGHTTLLRLDASSDQTHVLAKETYGAVMYDVEYNPEGRQLALAFPTASQVQVIDAETLKPLNPEWSSIDGYGVIDVEWSPDGRHLAVGTIQHRGSSPINGKTYVLDAGMLGWREQLCAIGTSRLTGEEWKELSQSTLPQPEYCNWAVGKRSTQAQKSPDQPSNNGDIDMTDLMAAAPVPAMCKHPAGTLVLGQLPNRRPGTGSVSLGDTAFGDLTGDGVDDAIASVTCDAGGVAWPPTFVTWTRDADGAVEIVDYINSSDPRLVGEEGSERPVSTGITVNNGEVNVKMNATIAGDPACCGSMPVDATLALQDGEIVVRNVVRQYDVAAVNQLLAGRGSPSTPTVLETLAEFSTSTIGAHADMCFDRVNLPYFLAKRLTDQHSDSERARYCTVAGVPEMNNDLLLLHLVPYEGERWKVIGAFL